MTQQILDCLFCRVASGEIPATVVSETDQTIAFRDIEPQAPVHVLVIPRDHYQDIGALSDADPGLAGALMQAATKAAAAEGLTDYRLVLNTGATAGQSVFHVHAHVLGGRPMAWPPG
ncbi:MAG TPA: histidine triad nucleotide-binding protein [Actinomycetes bacterium]|nr:histidine triad nucleotide-binding protein [Actinomycetes bacterium]